MATSLTSLTAHRLGGGALPSGAQWLAPLLALAFVGVIARPVKLTSRSVAALLVLGQLIGHVALELAVPHGMGGGAPLPNVGASGMNDMATPVSAQATTGVTTSMGASRVMLAAHVVGTVCAWMIAHLLLHIEQRARARWDALTGRLAVPRIVVRRRRVVVRRERSAPAVTPWATVAPLRGPPRAALAAH